jgi:hypothetical protein
MEGKESMAKERRKMSSLPSAPDFYLNAPLYTPYEFTKDQVAKVYGPAGIIKFPGPFDSFCVGCQKSSVFSDPSAQRRLPQPMTVEGDLSGLAELATLQQRVVFERQFHCMRNYEREHGHGHQLFFMFRIQWQAGIVMKVGQYPSLADLAEREIKKYRKLLGTEAYAEFSRGIGLFAHDVGIGAFVYLRRILEKLISEAHQAAQSSAGWDDSTYLNSRVVERIYLLRDHLPPFMIENRALYSILSKGVHEWAEEECLQSFQIMKLGIELILDQKLEAQERQAKISSASKDISALYGQLKGKGN